MYRTGTECETSYTIPVRNHNITVDSTAPIVRYGTYEKTMLHAAGVVCITKKVPTYDVYRTACGYNYYSKN
jgi:hypothetical protein